ncbi:MAG: methyltransferase domain-containing protein [Alphaproteobacteria bacterium]|nr:methyltransferase domain-containing protein [Alphaproteobacteria bacterium SS10]
MYRDVIDLNNFYQDRLGQVVQRLLRRRLRQMWPDLSGMNLLGFGYAGPLLQAFEEDAAAKFLAMPAPQGVMAWPGEGTPGGVALVHEGELPFEDASIDRIVLCHAVECSTKPDALMREVWRVLAGQGRLMVIAPNRAGVWARSETTPFGYGVPFSTGQLVHLLRDHNFAPERTAKAVFIPPVRRRFLLSAAPAWEEFGERWFEPLAGVNFVECSKQVFAGLKPQREAQRIKRPVLVPVPANGRPQPGYALRRDRSV